MDDAFSPSPTLALQHCVAAPAARRWVDDTTVPVHTLQSFAPQKKQQTVHELIFTAWERLFSFLLDVPTFIGLDSPVSLRLALTPSFVHRYQSAELFVLVFPKLPAPARACLCTTAEPLSMFPTGLLSSVCFLTVTCRWCNSCLSVFWHGVVA